jgi:hypothetical protein
VRKGLFDLTPGSPSAYRVPLAGADAAGWPSRVDVAHSAGYLACIWRALTLAERTLRGLNSIRHTWTMSGSTRLTLRALTLA